MKQGSRRSVIISILIALIVHLAILIALFMGMYHVYLHELHDAQEIMVLTQAGSSGTSVSLYQPPTSAPPVVGPSSVVEPKTETTYEPDVSSEPPPSDLLTVVQEMIPQSVEMPYEPATEGDIPCTKMVDLQEVHKEMAVQQMAHKKQPTSPRKRRQEAIKALKRLSFASPPHDTKPVLLQGDRGFASSTNVHDIVYQRYIRKIIQMMAAAINAERLRVSIDEALSCYTTLFVKVQRDGRMVDFHFESAHPTLRQLERAAQPVVQASWFYLPIPDSIPEDFIVMPLQVRVECRRGFDTYHFYFNE